MKNLFVCAIVALVFLGAGCKGEPQDIQEPSDTIDRDSILLEAQENGLIMDGPEIQAMAAHPLTPDPSASNPEDVGSYLSRDLRAFPSAALADVTGGESFGIAHAQFDAGRFTLVSRMGNLPQPASGYFYEGWLVQRGETLSVRSTGRAIKTQDGYANVYLSSLDLSDHSFYVLTLEADDGNPAPAEHILEGMIK